MKPMMPPEPDRAWLRNAALLTTAGVILFAVLTVLFIDLIGGSGAGAPVGAGDTPPVAVPVDESRAGDVNGAPSDTAAAISEADSAGAPEGDAEGDAEGDREGNAEADSDTDAPIGALSIAEGGANQNEEGDAENGLDAPSDDQAGSAVAASPVDPSLNVPFPPSVGSATDLEAFRDGEAGFGFQLPPGWQRTRVTPDLDRDPMAADYDVIFESPDQAQRIAVSVWDAAERADFKTWVLSAAGGMRPVDGAYPTNAYIAGEPALVVGEAESPTSPLRYAAFLAKGGSYLRIAWSAPTGAVRSTDYLRALATFQWPSADEATDSATQGAGNQAPPLRLPAGLYFPSDSLFSDGHGDAASSVDMNDGAGEDTAGEDTSSDDG
jgi:hypothetical protein